LSSSNAAFFISPIGCPDVASGGMQSCAVDVTYNPTSSGEDVGIVELAFDDGAGGAPTIAIVDVAGIAIDPEPEPEAAVLAVEASDSTLDFGTGINQ